MRPIWDFLLLLHLVHMQPTLPTRTSSSLRVLYLHLQNRRLIKTWTPNKTRLQQVPVVSSSSEQESDDQSWCGFLILQKNNEDEEERRVWSTLINCCFVIRARLSGIELWRSHLAMISTRMHGTQMWLLRSDDFPFM
jgi:hypothetical protein